MSIFSEKHTSEKILNKIKNKEWSDIFNNLCHVNNDKVILDYVFFKHIATKETYELIISHIVKNIDEALLNCEQFVIHINMKTLSVTDVDKHYLFIQDISNFFKDKYPNKLSKCYVYNAPFIFKQVFNIVSLFIDKETQGKIEIYS